MNALVSYVPNPFASILTAPYYSNSSLTSPTVQGFQLELPYPQFTSVTTDEPPVANSIFHALQITLEKRYSNGLQLSANYTFSKSIDDSSIYDGNVSWLAGTTSGIFGPQDPNKPKLDRSLSTFDIPQVLKLEYTYDLPIGQGRAFLSDMPRPLELLIGGWKTAGVWVIHDGFPLAYIMENGGNPIPTYGQQRPNITGPIERTGGGMEIGSTTTSRIRVSSRHRRRTHLAMRRVQSAACGARSSSARTCRSASSSNCPPSTKE